jgi:hypothetical protein
MEGKLLSFTLTVSSDFFMACFDQFDIKKRQPNLSRRFAYEGSPARREAGK